MTTQHILEAITSTGYGTYDSDPTIHPEKLASFLAEHVVPKSEGCCRKAVLDERERIYKRLMALTIEDPKTNNKEFDYFFAFTSTVEKVKKIINIEE